MRLRSADPTWAPAIDAGYLTDDCDLEALVTGMERARDIAAGPLARVLAEEWSPGGTVRGREALRTKASRGCGWSTPR
ncbi:GMC oxidoreductase [Modestobacter sp. DSM 44400]|uniref:GMC oxidoreductase n=1 Tax=Modestobacter sp. DSM 44400 TaxID=1550230 RepID=UPI0020C8F424|nr:GMC oxidoreductase [Modestobacter sp. DSM 44400]